MIHRQAAIIRLFAMAILLLPFLTTGGQINFPAGSTWRYLKGLNAATLDEGWMNAGFNDSQWSSGSAPFRYGDGTGGTLLPDMQNTYPVVYLRTTFTATNTELLDQLHLTVDYDDGFVVWINGQKILSQNAPLILSPDAFALDFHESGVTEDFYFEPGSINLLEGENTLAVQAFNINLESTDFLINVGVSAGIPEEVFQDTIGLQFSISSGFYTQPFSLHITPSNPAWSVYYTLDGSNPQYSETAMVSPGGATIQVDPQSTVNRDATPAVVVRASAGTGGITPSYPEARTYIFTTEVLTQSYPGGEWPDYNVNGQIIDLDMDGDVVNHASYKNLMVPSLKDIPSLSLITDIDNLFDSQIGIYVNAYGHGYEWERECAAELIQPDGTEGFNVNAGLRIRGGWSRHNDFPKHSFRLFFRAEYGDPKLDFPLFGEEGIDRYDKIDIRTSQNYAWSTGDSRNTMLREVFSRDTQRDMGQPYTRSRYYHLYLNGMYWGLFQTQERSEARFAADYLGGDTEDYDVIKVNTEDWQYRIEATDGDFTLWNEIWNMCQAGFSSGEAYNALVGKDSEGNPLEGGQVYVDIDNLIDYMLSIFYTGNFDAPTSSFGGNRGPNNFFAINNRKDLSEGFTFYNHDAEHAMFSEPASPGVGLYEDRVNLNMSVSDFSAFHPQWLHHKLTDNSDYRTRFMDRAYELINGDGVLSTGKNLERLNSRIAEIETAIIAESARWGDAKSGSPYTRDEHWIPEVDKIVNDFIPLRTNILIDQLKTAGLYSELESPQVFSNGTALEEKVFNVTGPSSLVIKNPNGSSTIYYTIDGTDPRVSGGGFSTGALSGGSSQVSVNFTGSGILKSRIHFGGEWSALKEINLISGNEDYSNLVITEIHYHPDDLVMDADTIDGKDFEFIEFKNIGNNPIALGGLILDSAVYYEFPADALLAPGQFHVVVSKPSKFYLRYGMVASGNFQKNFSNGGEDILLKNPDGIPLMWFSYSDDPPWPTEPDGLGYSLVSAEHNPTGNPAMATYWTKSYHINGSPFADEPFPASDGPVIQNSGDMRVYPNPASEILNIELPGTDIEQQATIDLYGINGNLLYQDVIYGNGTIQLSGLNLTPGVYLIRVQTLQRLYTGKIIIR